MRSMSDRQQQVLEIVRSQGAVRPRDLEALGVPRVWLSRLRRKGLVERVGRGLYVAVGADITEHHTMVEVAKRVPNGVVCLISALSFHELTTQIPGEVWLAVDRKAWAPLVPDLPVRIVRFSGAALTLGVEDHLIEGVPVHVYSAAKTVVDCFRYRNKVGIDVAIEALRDCVSTRKATIAELGECARQLRAENVMRPYLESLIA